MICSKSAGCLSFVAESNRHSSFCFHHFFLLYSCVCEPRRDFSRARADSASLTLAPPNRRCASIFAEDPEDRALRPQRMRDMVGPARGLRAAGHRRRCRAKAGRNAGAYPVRRAAGLGQNDVRHLSFPRDLGVGVQIASGAALMAPKDVVPYLTNAEEGSVLFIDEIHRLPKAVEEFLYPAMEDFRIDITLGEGVNARTINMPLKPFTLIGATTRTGMLSAPLARPVSDARASRFLHDRGAVRNRPPQRRQAAGGNRRRGGRRNRHPQPRHAATGEQPLALGPRLRHQQGRRPHHARELPRPRSKCRGSTTAGSTRQDRKYLDTIIRIFHGGPVGVDAVAHTMNTAPDTLEDEVEPFCCARPGRPHTRAAAGPRPRRTIICASRPPADDQPRLF